MTVADLFVKLGVDASELNAGFSAAEKRVERFSTQLFFLGSRTTIGVTAPILAAVGVVGKIGVAYDKAFSESLAIIKERTPQIESALESTAFAVAKSTKFSAEEAAAGYYHLISAGIQSADVLKGALPIAARFAQAGMMDMAKSTEFLAGAQAAMATGMESGSQKVADMAKISDVLTEANNRALGTIEDFANALTNRAGAALRQSNKSVEEGVAVLAAYAEQNIKGKVAGQQLWMVIRDLGIYALKNADAFKRHQIAVYDNTGAMRNMADIIGDVERATAKMSDAQKSQMFQELGIPARSVAATKALIGYSGAIREHQAALEQAGGATQKVADNQMLALSNRMLQVKHDFEVTAIEIFKGFVPVIEGYVVPVVRTALEAFKDFGHFIIDLPPPLKLAALAAAGFVAAIGPVLTLVGSAGLLASGVVQGFALMTGAVGTFSTAIGGIGTGITTTATAMQGLNIAATAASTVLGTAGATAKVVVLNQQQLREAMNLAAAAASAGASAMGMNAAKTADMALEARIAVANANRLAIGQAAVNDAMLAAGASTSIAARALAFLTNPITLVVGGLALAGAAWYAYTKYQEAARQAVIDHMSEFQKQTKALENSLQVWDTRAIMIGKSAEAEAVMATTVKTLADASGLSSDKFLKEAGASGKLTDELRAQLHARQELVTSIRDDFFDQMLDAEKKVAQIEQQIRNIGVSKVTYGAKGETFSRDTTIEERKKELAGLTVELARAKDKADEVGAAFRKAFSMPIKGESINLNGSGRPLNLMNKKKLDAAYKAYMADLSDPTRHVSSADLETAKTNWQKMISGIVTPGAMPNTPDPNSPANRLKSQIADMKDAILGTGGKELATITAAWHQLLAETGGKVANDPTAVNNLWAAYAKLRGELTVLPPEFEKLFAAQIEQQNVTAFVKDGLNDWGQTWSDNAVKVVGNIGKISVAMLDMTKADLDSFFKKQGSTLDELIPYYNQLEPAVQVLIDRYQQWQAAIGNSTNKLSENAGKAQQAITEYADAAAAKLSDAQDQLSLFSSKYADREIVALRKGLATQTAAMKKEYDKRFKDLALSSNQMSGEQFKASLAELNQAQADGEKRIAIEKRIGLLRIAEAAGVGEKIIRNEKKLTDDQIAEIIKRQQKLNDYMKTAAQLTSVFQSVGNIAKSLGMDKLEEVFTKATAGIANVNAGLAMARKEGATTGEQLAGYAQAAAATVDTFMQISKIGSQNGRIAAGAMAGAEIGTTISPGVGTAVGGGLGALIGAFMDDPAWKKLQDDVKGRFKSSISQGLSEGLQQAAMNLQDPTDDMIANRKKFLAEQTPGTRSRADAEPNPEVVGQTRAMFQHLGDVIKDSGGLNAGTFQKWSENIAMGFQTIRMGGLSVDDMASGLDQVFGSLVETGTKTSGVLSQNVVDLILLSRQYGVASKAVKEYVGAQLGIASEGFNQLSSGLFGGALQSSDDSDASEQKQVALKEKIEKIQAQIADYEKNGVNNEKQRIALLQARIHLETAQRELKAEEAKQSSNDAAVTSMSGPDGQAEFDRMSRLADLLKTSMQSEGKDIFEVLDAIGPGLDTLIAAQKTFGFETNASFESLMKFREFATVHPELVAQIQGLTKLTVGLNNSAYLTQEGFQDLASQASDTMKKSVDAGLTQDEVYSAMHKDLQALWELQRSQNFTLDEGTQAMLDQAEASGAVGEKYMSSNDKMVEGINRLNQLFEAFLRHLGVDIPKSAADAAKEMRDHFNDVKPHIKVGYEYEYDGPTGDLSDLFPGRTFHPGGSDYIPPGGSTPGGGTTPTLPPDTGGTSTTANPRYRFVSGHDEGAIVTQPHLAVVHSQEAIMPISELWDQLDKRYDDDTPAGQSVTLNDGAVRVSITAPYYQHEEEYIARVITPAIIDAIGQNAQAGLESAVTEIVKRAVDKIGRNKA